MIKIREHKKEDVPLRVKWLSDPKVNKFIGDTIGQSTTLRKEKKWFKNYRKDKTKKFFTILDDETPIGFIGFSNINTTNKNADLFIVIGEDGHRGKGFGKDAAKWLIDFGFNKLKLHKINLGVVKENTPAVKLYESLGFKIEGEMKDEVFGHGIYHGFLSMALFSKE